MAYYAIELLLAGLATYYITYALIYTDGMGGIFYRLRNIRSKFNPTDCAACTAFWVGLVVALGVFGLDNFILHGLALAGLTVFVDKFDF